MPLQPVAHIDFEHTRCLFHWGCCTGPCRLKLAAAQQPGLQHRKYPSAAWPPGVADAQVSTELRTTIAENQMRPRLQPTATAKGEKPSKQLPLVAGEAACSGATVRVAAVAVVVCAVSCCCAVVLCTALSQQGQTDEPLGMNNERSLIWDPPPLSPTSNTPAARA